MSYTYCFLYRIKDNSITNFIFFSPFFARARWYFVTLSLWSHWNRVFGIAV